MSWINCSERMPEGEDNVLVVGRTVFQGVRYAAVLLGGRCKYAKGGWSVSGGNYWDDRYEGNVTHWMPTPELPEEKI